MTISSDFAQQDRANLLSDSDYAQPDEPGFLEGSLIGAAGRGVASGFLQLAGQAAQYGNDPSQAILMDVPTDAEEMARREEIGRQRQEFAASIRPSADANGKAAQLMFDLSDSMTRFGFGLASGGLVTGAATVGASTGEQQFSDLRAKGVDAGTAAAAGALQGAAGAAMVFMPAARFVKPLAGDLAIATGLNVGVGVAQRGSTAALLERNGYSEQAKQFAAFDREAILTDGILGAAFFGVGRLATRGGPAQADIDAALTATNARNLIVDSAPGAPVDIRTELNHQRMMDHVAEQINRGEQVTVPEWYSGEFLVRDNQQPLAVPREAIEAMAADQVMPEFVARAEADAARAAPNVADLKAEADILSATLAGIDDTFRVRAKDFQRQGQSRKKAESSARASIAAERESLSARQQELNEALEGNRAAERAKADLAAMRRGEEPDGLRSAIVERSESISQGFQQSALSRQVAAANALPADRVIDRQVSDLASEAQFSKADLGSIRVDPEPQVLRTEANSLSRQPGIARRENTSSPAGSSVEAPNDLQLAQDVARNSPDTMINSGYDSDGNALQAKIADVLAEIEAERQSGVKDGQSFMAAVKCLIGA